MDIVKIFLSHNSKYIDLAASLKNSLHALEVKPSTQLDVKISEEMEGATDWRQWIEDNVRSADIFLLLFPHASMDMSWCNYNWGVLRRQAQDRVHQKHRHTQPAAAFSTLSGL